MTSEHILHYDEDAHGRVERALGTIEARRYRRECQNYSDANERLVRLLRSTERTTQAATYARLVRQRDLAISRVYGLLRRATHNNK